MIGTYEQGESCPQAPGLLRGFMTFIISFRPFYWMLLSQFHAVTSTVPGFLVAGGWGPPPAGTHPPPHQNSARGA